MSDDFDDDELDIEGSSFDDFEQKDSATLGDLWRNNSMVKIGVIAAAAIAILGIIIMFGEEERPPDMSLVPSGSSVNAPPGTEAASEAYVDAVEEKSQERVEIAEKQGGSALPTPIDPASNRLEVPEEQREQEDPLQRWRQIQEERLQRELEQTKVVDGPIIDDTSDNSEAIKAMAELMSQQMQAILESQSQQPPIRSAQITSPTFLDDLRAQEEEQAQQRAEEAGEVADGDEEGITLLPAGEILYAQLITEANSDVPGPVLAEIMSGPLKGSKILGDFEVQNELITLNFNTIVYKEESLGIEAVAVDPNTTLTGMATEVDHRYFRRIVLPMAAAFVEGAAEAISESGRTNITIQGETVAEETEETDSNQEVASGIEEAGEELRDILEEMADNTEVLVRIASGTPMGILFISPVVDDSAVSNDSQ